MKQSRKLSVGLLFLLPAFFLIGPVSRGLGTPADRGIREQSAASIGDSAQPCQADLLLVTTFQGADADRGCCLWKISGGNKCSYTNRGYCRRKAEELKVEFEFHKDKRCETVGGCPSVTPR